MHLMMHNSTFHGIMPALEQGKLYHNQQLLSSLCSLQMVLHDSAVIWTHMMHDSNHSVTACLRCVQAAQM